MKPETIFQTLSDRTRLRTLMLLDEAPALCVCHVQALLELPQSTISRHLSLLRERALVIDTRKGTWIIYRLNEDLPAWVREIIGIARREWAQTEEGRNLLKRARSIFDQDVCPVST
ncbi:MAG: metalloregulator ArsR/SmtB family transcription factor [Halothiobacillaceae bacterium]